MVVAALQEGALSRWLIYFFGARWGRAESARWAPAAERAIFARRTRDRQQRVNFSYKTGRLGFLCDSRSVLTPERRPRLPVATGGVESSASSSSWQAAKKMSEPM